MKIVHRYANSCTDWLISGQQSDDPLREAISILSRKYKRLKFMCMIKIFRRGERWWKGTGVAVKDT